MKTMKTIHDLSELPGRARDWWDDADLAERRPAVSPWLVAGVVAVGVGFLMWHYLGPDLRRYMKIHSM